MTERERLIEVLENAEKCLDYETMADYLLNNGVIILPCKIGDTVYVIDSPNRIIECKVYNICTNIYADNSDNGGNFWKSFKAKSESFNKTVFLSREEAEKAKSNNED